MIHYKNFNNNLVLNFKQSSYKQNNSKKAVILIK